VQRVREAAACSQHSLPAALVAYCVAPPNADDTRYRICHWNRRLQYYSAGVL